MGRGDTGEETPENAEQAAWALQSKGHQDTGECRLE